MPTDPVYAIPDVSTLQRRLAALEADPTLRFTAARWRAHEELYPGRGAATMIAAYADRDGQTVAEVQATLGELRAANPAASEVAYLEWVLAELTRHAGDHDAVAGAHAV